MANEIQITGGLSVTKSGAAVNASGSKTTSMSTTSGTLIHHIQDVGASAEAVVLGDIATTTLEYFVWLKNLDAAAYIDVDFYTGDTTYAARIRPGESLGPIRMNTEGDNPLKVKSSSGTVQMEVCACEAGDPAV